MDSVGCYRIIFVDTHGAFNMGPFFVKVEYPKETSPLGVVQRFVRFCNNNSDDWKVAAMNSIETIKNVTSPWVFLNRGPVKFPNESINTRSKVKSKLKIITIFY